MFQSDRSSCSHVWDFNHLRNILRISENQLKLLNSIPGWSKTTNTSEKIYTVQSHPAAHESKVSKKFSKETNNNSENLSEKTKVFDIKKTLLNKEKLEKNLLKRSASVDSIYRLNSSFDFTSVKRTKSFSNMAKAITSIHPSHIADLEPMFFSSKTDMQITAVNSQLTDLKSQFMDSAVQCQMSQSSQMNLEVPLSQRINNSILKSSSAIIKKNVSNSEKTVEPISITSDSPEKITLKNNACTSNEKDIVLGKYEPSINIYPKSCVSLNKENCKEDDSFVSQPISCAQPIVTNALVQKELLTCTTKTQHSSITLPSILDNTKTIPNENKVSLGKRKRKVKQDKIPKKLRGMDNVNVQYSSDQIKEMFNVMKMLYKI